MKCAICNKTEKAGKIIKVVCGGCGATFDVHEYHLKSVALICHDPDHAFEKVEEVEEGPILVDLGAGAGKIDKLRKDLAKLGVCHGCLGKSRIEREYQEWLVVTEEERSLVEGQLSKKPKDTDLLEQREKLNLAGKKYGRSAAHCIIPNQMLEWYSPMIVVSFYDIQDVDNFDLVLHSSADKALEAVEGLIMKHFDVGNPTAESQVFDRVMTELCRAIDTFQLGGRDAWIPQILAAMRYAIASRLRIGPSMMSGITQMKALFLGLKMEIPQKLDKLPHRLPKPTTSPIINESTPPKHGGGDPLKRCISDVKSLDINIMSLIGNCRAPVFEVGKQCHDCEEEQGDDSLIFRYLNALPIGRSLLGSMLEQYNGNPWLLTVDFMKHGIDHFVRKFNNATRGNLAQLFPYLAVIEQNRLLFCLYYATCMLEACAGLSPFRVGGIGVPLNACIIVRKK